MASTKRGRRWPVVALSAGGLLLIVAGVLGGAASATASAASTAARLTGQGDYATAIALDDDIATRTGPLYILDRADVQSAARNSGQTMLAWAASLGRAGHIDAAVALYQAITAPALRGQATAARATLLVHAAEQAATRGDYAGAVVRLEQVVRTAPGTAQAARAQAELPVDQVGEATALIAGGRGADALMLLDQVATEGSQAARAQAAGLYPAALLGAGIEEVGDRSYKEALTTLKRLVGGYAGSGQAAKARAMLSAPQPVSGTLVDAKGKPISGRVRLSSHYTAEPGGTYLTSAPFFYSTADSNGDFTIGGIPVGGPYVLEFFSGGNWTTLVDPNTGQPADPVTVTPLVPVSLTFIILPS